MYLTQKYKNTQIYTIHVCIYMIQKFQTVNFLKIYYPQTFTRAKMTIATLIYSTAKYDEIKE